MRDLVYAARSLARSRSFTVASVLTLAIGIGAATTISSIVNTILLEPLPFPDSDRFVRLLEPIAFGFMSFGLRTRGNPAAAIPGVRSVVRAIDANATIDAIHPMEQMVGYSIARQRFYAVLLGIFASVAGVLAAIGIYGVLAYSVVQRTQEIGVRMALGAERAQVLALVMRRGLVLACAGIAAGLLGAFAGARYLQSMLFGIEPRDPSTFIAVAAMFAGVAAVASYLPARRATKVDPMVALRVD